MTKEEAKQLCIKKWQWIVDHDGSSDDIEKALPELVKYPSNCAYCELFRFTNSGVRCIDCPINMGLKRLNRDACCHYDHPWNNWVCNRTKENAQTVLDLIINS